MSYQVQRRLGYEPWGVTNPWVFANFGQPQRARGYVSPMVFKTHPPRRGSHYLGQADDPARAARMERYTIAGLVMSAASLGLYGYIMFSNRMKKNARRRRRVRRNTGFLTTGTRVKKRGSMGGASGSIVEVFGDRASVRWDSGGRPEWVDRSTISRV